MELRGAFRFGLLIVLLVLAWRALSTRPGTLAPRAGTGGTSRGTLVVHLAGGPTAGGAQTILRGGSVFYTPVRAATGADSVWRAFEQLPAGEYVLTVKMPAGAPRDQTVHVRAGGADTIEVLAVP